MRNVVGDTMSLRLGISGDSSHVVSAASFAAGKFVVRAVLARLGIDDEVSASESVQDNIDQTGTSNNSTLEGVSTVY